MSYTQVESGGPGHKASQAGQGRARQWAQVLHNQKCAEGGYMCPKPGSWLTKFLPGETVVMT